MRHTVPDAGSSHPPLVPTSIRDRLAVVVGLTALLLAVYAVVLAPRASAVDALISQGKPATASSTESAAFPASAAVDGSTTSRWSSAFSDPQWIQIDLGATYAISQVALVWERAYATAFQIQVSPNATAWTTIYNSTAGSGGTQQFGVTGTGRYIRMYGTARSTGYGYSLWEMRVYGSPVGPGGCQAANAALYRPATSSSVQSGSTPPAAAVDGSLTTAWASDFTGFPQWLVVDLGYTRAICGVTVVWGPSYARSFQIQVSSNGTVWSTVWSTTTGMGGTQDIYFTASGRYVRLSMTVPSGPYGYAVIEFQIRVGSPVTPAPSGA